MKYLKNYKFFESIESLKSIVEYCEDILLPIKDDNIEVSIIEDTTDKEFIYVNIGDINEARYGYSCKIEPFYSYNESFEHLFNYIESQGFNSLKFIMFTSGITKNYYDRVSFFSSLNFPTEAMTLIFIRK